MKNLLLKKTPITPFIVMIIIVGALLANIIPMTFGLPVLICEFLFLISYCAAKKEFVPGFTTLFIICTSFYITGLVKGFNNIIPMLGIFIFGSFAVVNLLRMTFFFPDVLPGIFRLFFLLMILLYMTAGFVYIKLFPSPLFTIVPMFIAVIPGVALSIIINRNIRHKSSRKPSKLSLPIWQSIVIVAVIGLFIGVTNYYTSRQHNRHIAEQLQHIQMKISELGSSPDGDDLIQIGYAYACIGYVDDAEIWLEKAHIDGYNKEIIDVYQAYVTGVKSRLAVRFPEKMRLLETAMHDMDSLADMFPENLEIRFIRAMLYSEIPVTFGKTGVAKSDLLYILMQASPKESIYARSIEEVGKRFPGLMNVIPDYAR